MKITYLKLENVAGIYVGSNKRLLEIDFSKSRNKITSIIGRNGSGKSVLVSSLSPFASVTSLDERSTLPFILEKENGYKEIHYQDGNDTYIIKHYYKATKDSHTVKSYFMKNGEELNENGNVTSFLSLVEIHFGLTQEMMRLMRLGTNVNSFITLSPAKRKEYIGKLIEEINLYLQIYKKINEDIRTVKVLMTSNNTNLYNCHISDVVVEENNLANLSKKIKEYERDRDKLVSRLAKIKALMNDNNIDELKRKKHEAESSLVEFKRTEDQIRSMSLENMTVEKLVQQHQSMSERRIDTQSKINSYRISIDNSLKSIERLELSIKKITANHDIQSLTNVISELREKLKSSSKIVKGFVSIGATSEELNYIINKLSSFNQIAQMIYTFGKRPSEVYIRLIKEGKSVDDFLRDQRKKSINRINESDIRVLMDRLFKNDSLIMPNCDTEYMECPYYRLSEVMDDIKTHLEEESYDDETLRYIQVISNNVDNILNELEYLRNCKVPDKLKDSFKEKSIIDRFTLRLPFFDISPFQEYLTIIREYEIYCQDVEKLKQLEYQLSVYKQSGIDAQLSEIKELQNNIGFYKHNIQTLQQDIVKIEKEVEDINTKIAIVTKYNDNKKYKKMVESTLESTRKILDPLESAAQERMELEFSLRQLTNTINATREEHHRLEVKITEYNRLVKLGATLEQKHRDLNIILESTSTKKGIPVIYMKSYLDKIQHLANNLLRLIYDDEFSLDKFEVTPDSFEVPYIKNGKKIPDVKYASQSEVALVTMALSFALANRASGSYNILLLDEIDAGLDEDNRSAFLKMLYMQMNTLKAEQVFIISHNLSQMVNIPMDCIQMSDTGIKSKLQNIIYE